MESRKRLGEKTAANGRGGTHFEAWLVGKGAESQKEQRENTLDLYQRNDEGLPTG